MIPGWHEWPDVERVCTIRLAEIDAKRLVIRLYESAERAFAAASSSKRNRAQDEAAAARTSAALCAIVQPYADRDGYRDEWRPI